MSAQLDRADSDGLLRVAQKSLPNGREGSPGRSEKNEKSIAQRKGTSARYKAEVVMTAQRSSQEGVASEMMAQTVRPRRR